MTLTGKTIGQLTYLSEVTDDTLFPVDYSNSTGYVTFLSGGSIVAQTIIV